MAQVAEIKYGQKVMEKETEKRISEIEGVCLCLQWDPKNGSKTVYFDEINSSLRVMADDGGINTNRCLNRITREEAEGAAGVCV